MRAGLGTQQRRGWRRRFEKLTGRDLWRRDQSLVGTQDPGEAWDEAKKL
jgi:hypothetical protein